MLVTMVIDVNSWPIRKQILFFIGLTLVQGTIITFAVLVLAYFSDSRITIVQMVLLGILACLMASGLTFWLSFKFTNLEWKNSRKKN